MKNYTVILCVLLFTVSCSQKNSIEDDIKNLGADTLFISILKYWVLPVAILRHNGKQQLQSINLSDNTLSAAPTAIYR
jgi:hypothetical protein